MSVGPLGGLAGSAAGSPLAQTQGAAVERARQDAAAQERRIQSDEKADAAAGIGKTDGEDHETAQRDADGRRLWEGPAEENTENAQPTRENHPATEPPQGKEATGGGGTHIDLTG